MFSVVSVVLLSIGDYSLWCHWSVTDRMGPLGFCFPFPHHTGAPHPLPWSLALSHDHTGTPLHRDRLESRRLAFDWKAFLLFVCEHSKISRQPVGCTVVQWSRWSTQKKLRECRPRKIWSWIKIIPNPKQGYQ